MKRKHRKNVPLEVLQEKARQRTFEALKDFEIPLEIRDKVVLGALFDGDYRVFELYVPGEKPSDALVISRVRMNVVSCEAEGPVEVFALQPRSKCEG